MKTIFILPSMHFSGGVKVVIQLANRLHDMGMDTEIWYPTLPKYGYINLCEQKYIPVNVPVHRYLTPSQIPPADTYVATAWDTAITVDRLCRKRRSNGIYFIQHIETWDYYNTGKYSFKDIECLRTYNLPLTKIVTSNWLKEQVRGSIKIPVGIDPVGIRKKPRTYQIMGFIRGLPWKGDRIVMGLKEHYGIKMWIAKGITESRLKELYQMCDIYVNASRYEGFNLPVLEAMAYGCVCVTPLNGAIPEYSKNGSLVVPITDPDNLDEYIQKIDYLYKDTDLRDELGQKASREANRWTLKNTAEMFYNLLVNQTASQP
jgi:hypothetical protein